ncbi:sulfate permease [Flagellatimonas centrodinii]|uniref:SulP family inorganic anion transporter n=1 Tax=Flagellatimonas centrodinii TaxID=2806210 RepID=UPI001FEDC10A|nr:sulfate permease [Flagellatimonas centrodinii]ULQ45704.1 sulfate permease [Flagellatimonas centrodinii]
MNLRRHLPLLADLRGMGAAQVMQDLVAGTITAILLIPQALAYALLAGLPPEVGLYASVLPPVLYALTGSSRTLSLGPVAVAAVMVAAALTPFAGGDPQRYLGGALMLSAMVGAMLLVMGVLRLGWLTHFISHPVLSGFTTGAAIFIVGTQLAALTGIPVPRDVDFVGSLQALAAGLTTLNPVTVSFGLTAVGALLLARAPLLRLLQSMGLSASQAAVVSRAAPLLLVVVGVALSVVTAAAARHGVAVVGVIPQGLPVPSLAFLHAEGWRALLPSAALIALIGYVESISVARTLAFRRRQRIDPDQELRALGISNLGSAVAGAMPVAGGFSRSMVNFEAGAQTQLAAVITALWVALAAFGFTGLLAPLPKAVLAAIIVVAVWQLIDLRSLRHTFRFSRADGAAQAATLLGVLAFGIEAGLMIGVVMALTAFLYRTSRPHVATVGRIPGTEHFRNVHRHVVETWPALLLIRIDEHLYFANTPRLETELQQRVVDQAGVEDVVLVLSGVGFIDASGLEMLDSFEAALRSAGQRLHLAEVKGPVMDQLRATTLLQRLGPDRLHLSAEAAVRACRPVDAPRTVS